MPRFKNLNGINVQLTEAEETQRDADEEQAVIDHEAIVAKEAKKASGKQKLKDLGLDDAEIKALTGA